MNIPVELLAVLLAAILAVSGWSLKILWRLSERITRLEDRFDNLFWMLTSAGFPNPKPKTKHATTQQNQIHPQFNPLPGGAD